MMNIYLTDSGAYVDFVKDHEEIYNKNNENFKDKVREECLCERFTSHRSCLSKCAGLSLNPKGRAMENSDSSNLAKHPRK